MIRNLILLDLRKLLSLRFIMALYAVIFVMCEIAGLYGSGMATGFGFIILIYLWVYGPSGYGGDQLYGILPVTRRQVVLARYGSCMCGTLLGAACVWLVRTLDGQPALDYMLGIFSVGCIFTAVTLPPLLYFGPTKTRYYLLAVYGIGIAASGAFGAIGRDLGSGNLMFPAGRGIGIACLSFGILIASCLITLRLFQKREFDA